MTRRRVLAIGLVVGLVIHTLSLRASVVADRGVEIGSSSPPYFLQLVLPTHWAHPTDQFEIQFEQLHVHLQDLVSSGQIMGFAPIPEAWGVNVSGASPEGLDQLARTPGIASIEPGYPETITAAIARVAQAQATTLDGVLGSRDDEYFPSEKQKRDELDLDRAKDGLVGSDAEPARPPQQPKVDSDLYFEAQLYSNYVNGYGPIDTTITVELWRDGSLLATDTTTSSSSGSFYAYLYDSEGYWFAMQPNDVVEVIPQGQSGETMILPALTVVSHLTNDMLWGSGPPDVSLSIALYDCALDSSSCTWIWQYPATSGSGDYNVPLAGQADVTANDSGWIYYDDVGGNTAYTYFYPPRLGLRIDDDYFSGAWGGCGLGTSEVAVTLKNVYGQVKEVVTVGLNDIGSFASGTYFSQDLQIGETVEMTAASGEQFSVYIVSLDATPDKQSDVVTGSAPAFASVKVHLNTYHGSYDQYVTAGSSGSFVADFDGLVDVSAEGSGSVYYWTANGHEIRLSFYVPYVRVDVTNNSVHGRTVPEAQITVTVKDSGGGLKGSVSTASSFSGSFSVYFDALDIAFGDWIEVVPAGAEDVIVSASNLALSPDPGTNTVTGHSDFGVTRVYVQVCSLSDCSSHSTLVDASGYFSLDFTPDHDIQAGDEVYAWHLDAQENQVSLQIYLASRLYASTRYDSVRVYTTANAPVDIVLKNASGQVKATVSRTSSTTGYLYENSLGDVAQGDQVEVTVNGDLSTLAIPQVWANLPSDLISGIGEPNANLWVDVSSLNGDYGYQSGNADTNGNFALDVGDSHDLTQGDYVALYASTGNRQAEVGFYLPSRMQVYPHDYRKVIVQSTAHANATINVKDAWGAIKTSVTTTISGNGTLYLYSSDVGDVMPQDTIEVTIGGEATSVKIPDAQASTATDSVWGTTSPNAQLLVTVSGLASGEDSKTTTSNSSGSFSISFSGSHNIVNGDRITVDARPSPNTLASWQRYLPSRLYLDESANSLYIYTSPSIDVTTVVRDQSGTALATVTGTSDSSGYLYFYNYDLNDLRPTDVVAVTADGVTVQETVVPLTALFDRAADVLQGQGPPNADLALSLYSDPYYDTTVQTDWQGAFLLDLAGLTDIQGGDNLYLYYVTTQGNQQQANLYAPQIYVTIPEDRISGYGLPNEPTQVRIKGPSGALKEAFAVTPSSGGYYCVYPSSLVTGDRIELDYGDTTLVYVMQPVTIQGEADQDVISGTGPVNGTMYVYSHHSGIDYVYWSQDVSVNSEGKFSVDLTGVYDVKANAFLSARHDNSEGDFTRNYVYVPGLSVDITDNDLWGFTDSGSVAALVLKHSSVVKGQASAQASSSDGYFAISAFCGDGQPADVVAGDQVILNADQVSLDVPTLSATLDPSTDTFAGHAPAGSKVELSISHWEDSTYYGHSGTATADDLGNFSYIDTTYDLREWDYGNISWEDSQGNQIVFLASATAPESLDIEVTSHPQQAGAGTSVTIDWEIHGGNRISSSYVRFDWVASHACDHNYTSLSGSWETSPRHYQAYLSMPDSGRLYFKVTAFVDGYTIWSEEYQIPVRDGDATTLYLPTVSRNSFSDPYEPNNSFDQAYGPLRPGVIYKAYFPTQQDEWDFYYLVLSSSQVIETSLTNIPAGNDYDLMLYDAEQNLLRHSGNPGSADEYILSDILPAGMYYLGLHRGAGTSMSQPYHLTVTTPGQAGRRP